MRHPVIGRRSAHASFLPRPLGNGIPHHHALLHLAEFTEVLLQALWEDKEKENRLKLLDFPPQALVRLLERDNGADHVVFVCPLTVL